MTVNRAIGVPVFGSSPGVGTTPLEARLALAGLYAENAPGVPRSGLLEQNATNVVTASTTDMSYNIAPCQLVISRSANEGVYDPTLAGTTNIGTGAAPASGSRWDLVYVLQRDNAKGDADNTPIVGVIQGTSGGSPTKPYGSVPAGGYVLAEAQIFAGSTNASDAPNTVTQVWRHTAARGGIITLRSQAEQDEITGPYPGQVVYRKDTGHYLGYSGTRWFGGPGTITLDALYVAFGAGWSTPSMDQGPDGATVAKGALQRAVGQTLTMTANTRYTIGSIPTGFRPSATKTMIVPTSTAMGGWGRVYVQPSGALEFETPTAFTSVPAANTTIWLDGLTWKATQ